MNRRECLKALVAAPVVVMLPELPADCVTGTLRYKYPEDDERSPFKHVEHLEITGTSPLLEFAKPFKAGDHVWWNDELRPIRPEDMPYFIVVEVFETPTASPASQAI